MAVRPAQSARGRLTTGVIVLALSVAGIGGVVTGAWFTGTHVITNNTFTSGSVNLDATPATSAITASGMVPGDKVTAPITVTSSGTLPSGMP